MMAARCLRLMLRPCWWRSIPGLQMHRRHRFASFRATFSAVCFSAGILQGIGSGRWSAQAADIPSTEDTRPAGLVLLEEKQRLDGKQALGIVAVSQDPAEPGLWRVKVWDELPNTTLVRHEAVRCGADHPMRVTNDGRQQLVRFLNPGGAITLANRRDHLVWWAVCFPEQAGRDPAQLGATARKLGFSGLIIERELVLPSRLP